MGAGRRSKYETHVLPNLDRIPKWRKQGMTEEQICRKLGVGVSTWNRYKIDFRELREAIKSGKEELIEQLEDSLYKRAMGYSYDETKTIASNEGGTEKRRIEKTVRHVPPDTGALAFSLKNLAPEKWRDSHDIRHSGGVTHDHKIEQELAEDKETQELLKQLYRRSKMGTGTDPNTGEN